METTQIRPECGLDVGWNVSLYARNRGNPLIVHRRVLALDMHLF
jgi:hypothetical protein